ncbi:MAG: tetratricopeptide repeat protein, partial [Pirellulales bacterium]
EAVPGNVDLLWNLADLLIQTDRAAEALEVIAQLREKKYPPAPLDYLSARLSIHKKDWREAADQLAKARAAMASWPDLAKQADFWLAHCHGRLGSPDLQIEAYQSALRVDESWAPARLGLAAALVAASDLEGAIREYRKLLQGRKAPLEVYPAIARLMFLQRLVVANPNWEPVLDVLNQAEQLADEKKLPASPDVPILRAEVAAAQGNYEHAKTVLETARDKQPEVLSLRLALAALDQRLDQWDQATGHLDQAERDLGDSADLRIARVRWVRRQYQTESLAHLARLEQSIEAFEPADKARLLHALASGYFSVARALPAGDAQREPALSEARRLWTEVGRLQPDHLTSRLFLFDLAIADGDELLMDDLLKDIRRIERAEAGPLWRYGEAARLVMLARKSEDPAELDDAQDLLTEAARQRPRWSRIPLLRTEIDELRNDRDAAIEHYRQAVGLGERNPAIIRRLVELLYREGQYKEADRQLRELDRQQALISVELGRLGSEISARIDEYPRAIDLAQRTAEKSNDYRDYIWLGQVLSLERNRQVEAEKALRDAVALAEHEPAPRVALVRFLHAQGRTDEAEAELANARELVAGEDWPLVLAAYYEATQRPELAGEQFREALAADPSSPAALRKLAEFYLRSGRPREAEPHLRELVDPDGQAADPDRRWARRNLAVALVARGDYASQRQALTLLEENLKLDDNSVDRRAKAVVLASQQRRRALREAIKLFEKLVQVEAPSTEDRFLLAQLYQADGNWPAARQQGRSLLAVQ